jgi:hypothetical protein
MTIGRFFGPPKQGSPPSPLRTTPTCAAASRVAEQSDGVVEVVQDDGRRKLDDAMDGPAMVGHERAERQLVGVARAERDGVRVDRGAVEPAGQRDDEARIETAGEERPDRLIRRRQTPAHRLFEEEAQPPRLLFFR